MEAQLQLEPGVGPGEIRLAGHSAVVLTARGALRLDLSEPAAPRLLSRIDAVQAGALEDAVIVDGRVFLEMWVRVPGYPESFSRGLHMPLTGTTEWTTQEILFNLAEGQNPEHVKLNVVVEGTGTVWVDDLSLVRSDAG